MCIRNRWQNLTDCHEMYCAGHMTEAGVAYYQATGKTQLLDICCKLCDHIDRRFGREAGKVTGIPGHEEIELALVKMYRYTKKKKYLDLAAFAYPAAMEERAAKMAAQGYTVDWYKEGVHRGVDKMVASLGNPMWDAEIPAAAHGGMRLLVGLSGDTVAGFTGPVDPEPTGRGYFAGIAVEERYRGHGLGKLLFYRLCRAEKECGAQYMSLFTGIDNPAQNIYKEAGFTPRRYFAVMIKELKP